MKCHVTFILKVFFKINLEIRINITDDDISGQELISQMQHVIQLPIVGSQEDVSSLSQIILSSINSEIIFKVYGKCEKDYYGPGCNQHCKPSASRKTGFYSCDRITGQKHCLIGDTNILIFRYLCASFLTYS